MTWDTGPVAQARISPRPSLPGCWFDDAAADMAANFFPWYCRFTAGSSKGGGVNNSFAGRPFHLEPAQRWIIRTAFGWKRADGTRLYRRVIVWVPRKNGKTELLAGVSHIGLTALGVSGADVYSIAAKMDQAKLVFKAAQEMVSYSPALSELYDMRKGSIYCPSLHTSFKPLSGKAHGTHGLKCYMLIGDEAHEWRDGELHQFVRQSMGLWADPMEWIISTAGKPEGYGYELWDESEQIVDGTMDDPETLVVMFGAHKDDDITDPKIWAKANPLLGVSLQRDYLATEVKRAQQRPSHMVFVKRYHFNLWTQDAVGRWIAPEAWEACGGDDKQAWKRYADELAGRACYGGLDLASTRDTNALVWIFPPAGSDTKWRILPRFWWPKLQAEAMRSVSRLPIEQWETEGSITFTPGNVADHDAIIAQIIEDNRRFKVLNLGIDMHLAYGVSQRLQEAKIPVVEVPQRVLTLSGPASKLERLVLAEDIEHGHQPVLRWQVGSTAIREYENGLFLPTKKKSSGKIDGVMAGITAMAVADTEPAQQSYLMSQPMLVL